jgi:hypothetical protein
MGNTHFVKNHFIKSLIVDQTFCGPSLRRKSKVDKKYLIDHLVDSQKMIENNNLKITYYGDFDQWHPKLQGL